jgi:hypothetical protein
MEKNRLIASLQARTNEVIQYIKDNNDISVDRNTLELQSWVNFHDDNIRLLLQQLEELKEEIHKWNAELMSEINEETHNY